MDNILSMNIELKERIESRLNYLGLDWDDIVENIDSKYSSENGKSCSSRIKKIRYFPSREDIANGVHIPDLINPTYQTLSQLADVLKCDITYLLGEHDHSTHNINDICNATGLSEEAVDTLMKSNLDNDYAYENDDFYAVPVEAINTLLGNELGKRFIRSLYFVFCANETYHKTVIEKYTSVNELSKKGLSIAEIFDLLNSDENKEQSKNEHYFQIEMKMKLDEVYHQLKNIY